MVKFDFGKYKQTESQETIVPNVFVQEGIEIPKVKISSKKTEEFCSECNRRYKIYGEKNMDKNEIIKWLSNCVKENEKLFTLDFLRGQKLIYETMVEMRK